MTTDPQRPALSADQQARLVAAVTTAHELAESPLDAEDRDRLRRLARGELTVAAAYAELDALYGPERPGPAGSV